MQVTCLDATKKKVAFIEAAVDRASVANVSAVAGRCEELAHEHTLRERFDVVTARAVAPLATLAELCLPFLAIGGTLVAAKGADVEVHTPSRALLFTGGLELVQNCAVATTLWWCRVQRGHGSFLSVHQLLSMHTSKAAAFSNLRMGEQPCSEQPAQPCSKHPAQPCSEQPAQPCSGQMGIGWCRRSCKVRSVRLVRWAASCLLWRQCSRSQRLANGPRWCFVRWHVHQKYTRAATAFPSSDLCDSCLGNNGNGQVGQPIHTGN